MIGYGKYFHIESRSRWPSSMKSQPNKSHRTTSNYQIQERAARHSSLSSALILVLVAFVFQLTPKTRADRMNKTDDERISLQPGLISKDLPSTESYSPEWIEMINLLPTVVYWIQKTQLVIGFFGIIGNLIVIFVILKFTREQTVTDILILNLASADLMFLTGFIMDMITRHQGLLIFGNLFCKFYCSATFLNMFASSLLLVVMSFDRYLLVCHPIYAQNSRQAGRARVICWCVWLLCFVLQTPVVIFARITNFNDILICNAFSPEYDADYERAFIWFSFAIGFLFPMVLISGFYIQVVRRLRQSSNHPNLPVSSPRVRSTKRIARLIIVLIFTYVICWLPYWIFHLSLEFLEDIGFIWKFYCLAALLAPTNSALNPILYAFLSDNFTQRFSQMVVSIRRANLFGRSPQLQTSISSRLAAQTIGQQAHQHLNVEIH